MTKVNTSNRTETKSHIFPYAIFKSEIIFPSFQNTKKKMNFIIAIFQSHCKKEQVK